MTREEAIVVLEESKRQNEVMRDNPSTFWTSQQMAGGVKNAERRIAALELALTALRPVSREAWVSVNERMPDEDQSVIVIANGKPRENITLDGAFELAEWSERDGWFLECWPDWENPVVTHWMPIPVPPEEAERCAGTI